MKRRLIALALACLLILSMGISAGAAPTVDVPVTGVVIIPPYNFDLHRPSGELQFTAEVYPANATNQGVTWDIIQPGVDPECDCEFGYGSFDWEVFELEWPEGLERPEAPHFSGGSNWAAVDETGFVTHVGFLGWAVLRVTTVDGGFTDYFLIQWVR